MVLRDWKCLLATLILAAGTSTVVRADETSLVPRHTIFPVLLTKEIRVGGAGDSEAKKVEFELSQDVIVNGHVVGKKGDTVEGHYTSSKNVTAHMLGGSVSEELALDVDDALNFCGDTVHLQFERTFRGGMRAGAFSFGAHVHDAVFPKGTILLARTDRVEKHICSERSATRPLALPSGALVPDDQVADPGKQ